MVTLPEEIYREHADLEQEDDTRCTQPPCHGVGGRDWHGSPVWGSDGLGAPEWGWFTTGYGLELGLLRRVSASRGYHQRV